MNRWNLPSLWASDGLMRFYNIKIGTEWSFFCKLLPFLVCILKTRQANDNELSKHWQQYQKSVLSPSVSIDLSHPYARTLRWTFSSVKSVLFWLKWTISAPGIIINKPESKSMILDCKLQSLVHSFSTCAKTVHFYASVGTGMTVPMLFIFFRKHLCHALN